MCCFIWFGLFREYPSYSNSPKHHRTSVYSMRNQGDGNPLPQILLLISQSKSKALHEAFPSLILNWNWLATYPWPYRCLWITVWRLMELMITRVENFHGMLQLFFRGQEHTGSLNPKTICVDPPFALTSNTTVKSLKLGFYRWTLKWPSYQHDLLC